MFLNFCFPCLRLSYFNHKFAVACQTNIGNQLTAEKTSLHKKFHPSLKSYSAMKVIHARNVFNKSINLICKRGKT